MNDTCSRESIAFPQGYRIIGHERCYSCGRQLCLADGYNADIRNVYVEIRCPSCGRFTRLPLVMDVSAIAVDQDVANEV